MMKRMLCWLLCLALVLGTFCAEAEETIPFQAEGEYLNPISTAAADGFYYALNQTDDGYELLIWQPETGAISRLTLPEEAAAAYDTVCLVVDGERLMLVSLTQGRAYALDVLTEEGVVRAEEVLRWHMTPAFYETDEFGDTFPTPPDDAIFCGDQLLLLLKRYYQRGEERCLVLSISMADGNVQELPLDNVEALSSEHETAFLFLQSDGNDQLDLMRYDMAKQSASTVFRKLGVAEEIPKIRYRAETRQVIYVQGQRVMALGMDGQPKQVGYLDSPYLERMEVVGDQVVCQMGSAFRHVWLCEDEAQAPSLTIYGGGDLDAAIARMQSQVADFQVYRLNTDDEETAEQLINRIISRDHQADLYIMNVGTAFLQMKRKGYCADLSAYDRLTEAAEDTHPFIRNVIYAGDALCALPLHLYAWGWQVDTDMMEELGLTLDDIPHSLTELCTFLTRWNDTWAYDFPEYAPVEDWSDVRAELLESMMNAYLWACAATDRRVDFLSEDFMQALTALDQVACDRIDSAQAGGWHRKGLLNDFRSVTGQAVFHPQQNGKIYLSMPLLQGEQPMLQTSLMVIFVNPASEHLALAVQFLEAVLETQDEMERHNLYTSCTAPVANPDYETQKAEWEQQRSDLTAALETASDRDQRMTLLEEQKHLEMMLDDLNPYLITPEGIAFYQREILPSLYLPSSATQDAEAFLNTEEVRRCMKRYLDGYDASEQFAQQLARIAAMMAEEDR